MSVSDNAWISHENEMSKKMKSEENRQHFYSIYFHF